MIDKRPAWQKSKAVAYLFIVTFMAIVGLAGWSTGNSPELIFLQMASIPVIFAAGHGIEQLFLTDRAYTRWTLEYFERIFGTSTVIAIGIMLLMARDGMSVWAHATNFLIMFGVLSAIDLVGFTGPARFVPDKASRAKDS